MVKSVIINKTGRISSVRIEKKVLLIFRGWCLFFLGSQIGRCLPLGTVLSASICLFCIAEGA